MTSYKCPHCQSDKTEKVTIRFMNGQEQGVMFCHSCKKIFRKGNKND